MDLVIVTGMSGAGKTQAANALEDMGYYCVDNVPPRLVSKFAELPLHSGGKIPDIALVVDVRSKELFAEFEVCIGELERAGTRFQILYLDCDSGVLMRRYKETRRRHPLLDGDTHSVERAIALERELLATAKAKASFVVDTSYLSPTAMKDRIRELFANGVRTGMQVTVTSFGFKKGTPADADLVFDVRCLPNPYWEEALRNLTGLDGPVRDFVLRAEQTKGLIPKLLDLIDYLIPLYRTEGKSQLVIAIGCTGGRHRSVVFAELIREHLRVQGADVWATHRDLDQLPYSQEKGGAEEDGTRGAE